MLVKRKSIQSRLFNEREIPITEEELTTFDITGYPPKHLNSSQIRFLTNGTTDSEWQDMLDDLDKEDDTDLNKRYHR